MFAWIKEEVYIWCKHQANLHHNDKKSKVLRCCWVWNEARTHIAFLERQVSCPYTSTGSAVLLAFGTAFWQATMPCW